MKPPQRKILAAEEDTMDTGIFTSSAVLKTLSVNYCLGQIAADKTTTRLKVRDFHDGSMP